ncbi:MAG: hypothetical protein FWF28_08220, partial [Micrococcales bacterium]|nr:hypothetical protein [Micrococcales bacterium]
KQQDASGGFASFGAVNTNSTGLAAQALRADPAVAQTAAGFIGGLQITCATVAENTNLSQADVGAISYDQPGFSSALTQGLDAASAATFLRASSQAVLGLGGADFASLSAAGATSGLPDLTCQTSPGATPTPTPTPSGGPAVDTGGSVSGQIGAALWLALVAMTVLGAYLARRAVKAR